MPACVIAVNAGTISAAGTTPHTATTRCFQVCQAISQAVWRAIGTTQAALYRDRVCREKRLDGTSNHACEKTDTAAAVTSVIALTG